MPTPTRSTAKTRVSTIGPKEELVVGVDLGGTKILAGVFTRELNCIGRAKTGTKAEKGSDEVVKRIATTVREAVTAAGANLRQVRAIGVGAPGLAIPERGVIAFAPNLKWKNVPLQKMLEKRLSTPTFIQNDGNLATLGVYTAEFSAKPRHLIGIFIGTGIGAGIIIDGKIYMGGQGTAGELGHMVIKVNGPKCGCGARGCLEALASRTAIYAQLRQELGKGPKSMLTSMLGPELSDLRSRHLKRALDEKDKLVQRIVKEASKYIGIAVANLNNVLNPEVIVLGGGVMEALESDMMPTIIKTARSYAIQGSGRVQIRASKLGDDAGIFGGAVLALNSLREANSRALIISNQKVQQHALAHQRRPTPGAASPKTPAKPPARTRAKAKPTAA